jgi:lipopolysaccharide heptosyltransferase II
MTDKVPSRVVVRPPNWLGDAVLALPALAAIRRHFPDAHLSIAAVPAVAALFREQTDVRPDQVMDLPENQRSAVTALEGGGFDLGILFPNSIRSAWQLRQAGIKERWGYPSSGRRWLLTRRSQRDPARRPHQSDYYRALVRGLGITCSDDAPSVRASTPSLERANVLLTERGVARDAALAGFAPGAAYGQAKQWPPDRMAAVIAKLVRERDVTCVVLGATHDRQAARAIESWLRAHAPEAVARVVDLVGRTSLGAFVGVASRCAVFVSNDSGAMHVAAALGRPVVAIFGPTDEHATRPLGDHDVISEPVFCRPCLLRDCPIDHRCMKRITIERVFGAAAARLASA